MKFYSIDKIHGSLFSNSDIIEAKNSKNALEKLLEGKLEGLKVLRTEKNPTFSVIECDEKGLLHYDKRKWLYYSIIKK